MIWPTTNRLQITFYLAIWFCYSQQRYFLFATLTLPQFQGAQILGSLSVYLEIIQQFSYTTEIYWLGSLEWFINILYKTDEAVISDAGDLDVQR